MSPSSSAFQPTRKASKSSGIQRSLTRSKVNVVSKASLAMLNPAHSMGIETRYSDDENEGDDEQDGSWPSAKSKAARDKLALEASLSAARDLAHTPELAAFSMPDGYLHESRAGDEYSEGHAIAVGTSPTTMKSMKDDAWNSGFGIRDAYAAPEMQRKLSDCSVFEDEEAEAYSGAARRATALAGRRPSEKSITSTSSSSNSSLSRLFTWKRSNKQVESRSAPNLSIPHWDAPASAPAHVSTFADAGYSLPPKASLDADRSNFASVPNTPTDAPSSLPMTTLPTASGKPSRGLVSSTWRGMSRKSSMPSLRDMRRTTAAAALSLLPVANETLLSHANLMQHETATRNMVDARDIYKSAARHRQPTSTKGDSSSLRMPAAVSRISSVGKGARKSLYDATAVNGPTSPALVLSPETPELSENDHMQSPHQGQTQQPRKVARKKPKQFQVWNAPTVPPLPPLEQYVSPMLDRPSTEKQHRSSRRRSQSVGAVMQDASKNASAEAFVLPSLVTPEGLFDTSIGDLLKQSEESHELAYLCSDESETEDEVKLSGAGDTTSKSQHRQAQRVNLVNRPTVVGLSSPKLVNFSPRMASSPLVSSPLRSPHSASPSRNRRMSSQRRISSRLAAPVVVNVMPPTPDLGAEEYGTFVGPVASPGVRRSVELSDVYSTLLPTAEEKGADVSADSDPQKERQSALDALVKAQNRGAQEPALPQSEQELKMFDLRQRTQSTMSDLSDISSSAASESSSASMSDDPFGFTRSLSMLSIDSNFAGEDAASSQQASNKDEHDDESSSESDSSCDDLSTVEHAQIVSVSPSSSFSKAQLISSPKAASLASPRCPELMSNVLGISSSMSFADSMASIISASPASSQSSKRFSGSRLDSLPSLSSGQTLASVMTTSTSISSADGGLVTVKGNVSDGALKDLSAPAEIDNIMKSMGIFGHDAKAASLGVMDEDDCETPRLSDAGTFNAPSTHSIPKTRPLNVRKGMSSLGTSVHTASPSDQSKQSPPSSAPTLQHSTPSGLSPTPMRPYPRAQNSSSPHLELDLSLPLDLHDIGLGLEVKDSDKPRRRAKGGAASGADVKPKLPVKSPSRRSLSLSSKPSAVQSAALAQQQPKTPPSNHRLMASAMARDSAMGLGLDLGLGFPHQQEPECDRKLASAPLASSTSQSMLLQSSASDGVLMTGVVHLTADEQHLLVKGAASSNKRMSNLSALRSSRALRSASVDDLPNGRQEKQDFSRHLRMQHVLTDDRPGSSDSSVSSASTIVPASTALTGTAKSTPMLNESVYAGGVLGMAM